MMMMDARLAARADHAYHVKREGWKSRLNGFILTVPIYLYWRN